jgi:hypothetical protein
MTEREQRVWDAAYGAAFAEAMRRGCHGQTPERERRAARDGDARRARVVGEVGARGGGCRGGVAAMTARDYYVSPKREPAARYEEVSEGIVTLLARLRGPAARPSDRERLRRIAKRLVEIASGGDDALVVKTLARLRAKK